jgi:mRNA interferase MazF
MNMPLKPANVVTVDFKRRPALIVSTERYYLTRPDVIIGLITSQIPNTLQPSDCILQDWSAAGLFKPSAFRTFLNSVPASNVIVIGHLSDRDWQAVQGCLRNAIAYS